MSEHEVMTVTDVVISGSATTAWPATLPLSAMAHFSDGTTMDVTAQATTQNVSKGNWMTCRMIASRSVHGSGSTRDWPIQFVAGRMSA